jgi:hypothetical protein
MLELKRPLDLHRQVFPTLPYVRIRWDSRDLAPVLPDLKSK